MIARWLLHIIAFGVWLAAAQPVGAALILPGTRPLSEASEGVSTTAADIQNSHNPWQAPNDDDPAYGPGRDAGMTEPPSTGGGAGVGLASVTHLGTMAEPAIGVWMAFYIAAFIPEPPPFRLLRPPRPVVPAV